MIPLRLRVRNFMCYRDDVPPLSFEGIHLACLTGANGHGKSALLDAITWSLWGKARARHDDELIHQGQSEMEVEYAFELAGAVYRVIRKRDSSKGGRTVLDLQVQHAAGFRSLAEPSVRATQAAIIRLLRMDYETFTNSAFLLQGRADAFTTRTPADRKQVLADILGLSAYDEYEQRARDRARERERQIAEVEGSLREADRELARRPEYEAELTQAEGRVAEHSRAAREAEAALRELRLEQQALEHQQARLRDLERRLGQDERELAELEAQIAGRSRRLDEYEARLAQRRAVEQGYAALVAARQAEAAWGEGLAQAMRIQNRQRELERLVDAARQQVEIAAGRLSERIADLERRAAEARRCEQDLAEAQSRLAELASRQAERDAAQIGLQALAEESAGLQVRNDQLRDEMEALKQRLELLQREAGQAECPLCGQALTDAHRDQLVAQFQAQGQALGDAHRANTTRRRDLGAESKRLQAEVQRLDQELAHRPAQQRREAQLEQALADAHRAAAELVPAHAEAAAVQERLRAAGYARDEQAELAHLAAELSALGYDAEAHQRARGEVAALAEFDAAYRHLQLALERSGEERSALADLHGRQARRQQSVAEDRAQRAALAAGLARLPEVMEQINAQSRQADELQAQSHTARLALGAAQQKLDHCRHLAVERERNAAQRQRLAEEKAVLDELRLAFGKKGIQAMIIEAAIPEIEFEANRLLSRMTEGRMHVRLETQRETLKGDTVETLDINIADELGTRPYELFSGGEAFRVNFAIRIALSRLLARRAGAQLQMLVIDEGFGTQDAAGRERLVEAITSIQEDFSRILVVTHIEELKDAFPVHIEVTKAAGGSHFRLS